MALKKEFETPTGAVGEYWKIAQYRYSPDSEVLVVELYISEEHRRAGKRPLLTRVFNFDYKLGERPDDVPTDYLESPFSLDAMNKDGANFLSVGYNWLKKLDLLSDSKDV